MSGRYTSSRIRSGLSSRAAVSASAPVRATPTARNPSTCSTKRRWISATMKSSSTTRTSRIGDLTLRLIPGQQHREPRTAGGCVADVDTAAVLGGHQPHQRQPDSPAAGNVGFRGDTAGEDRLAKMFGDTGSGVGDRDASSPRRRRWCTTTAAVGVPSDTSTALSMRLPTRVMTSVASAGSSGPQVRFVADLQRHPASRRPARSWRSAAPPPRDRRYVVSPHH